MGGESFGVLHGVRRGSRHDRFRRRGETFAVNEQVFDRLRDDHHLWGCPSRDKAEWRSRSHHEVSGFLTGRQIRRDNC